MTLKNLLGDRQLPQQIVPLVRVCWDELFAFLTRLFKPKLAIPIAKLDRLTTTSTEYAKVVEWIIPADSEGEIVGVALVCPVAADFANVHWKLVIAEAVKFQDKYIGASLGFDFGGCVVHSNQKVQIFAKSVSGASAKADGAIYGRQVYLE